MNHRPYHEWMHAALDGSLAPEQRAQLEDHLVACADCQSLWDMLGEVERWLKAEPLAIPRPGFTSRFKARLAQRRSRPKTMWGALALGLGAAGSAALVLPLGVGLLVSTVRVAQQPATTIALYSSLHTTTALAITVLEALFIAARALLEWALTNPLTWVACVMGLGVTVVWLYCMRKLVPEVLYR